jgi:prolycopene isomerase
MRARTHARTHAPHTHADTDVHHILLEAWEDMEKPRGTLFVSIPTL